MNEQKWAQIDRDEWEQAAVELEVDGWERDDTEYPVLFHRDDVTVFLGRTLGKLDWTPRER